MRRVACRAIAVALVFASFGCEEETIEIPDGPGNMNPMPPDPPPPPPPGGIICLCPGFFERPFEECPREPKNGDLQVNFVCSAASAIFENGTMCNFRITTSNSLALLIRPNDWFIPISTPQNPFTPVIVNTQANDPPGGVVRVSATDVATNTSFDIGDVVVSNNCP